MPRPREYKEILVYNAIHEYWQLNRRGPTNEDVSRISGIKTMSLIARYKASLRKAGLIEYSTQTRSMRIVGKFVNMKVDRNAVIFEDNRRRRALRDWQTPTQRAEAARKGLRNRKQKRRDEDALIDLAVQMANANEHEVIGVDFVHDYRNRQNGAFHARRLG